jgi:alpha-ketoglutarate-dependent taurine dioxygenase
MQLIRRSLQSVQRRIARSSPALSSSTPTRKRWLGSSLEKRKEDADDDKRILALPRHFLRAMDETNFDATTGQRRDVEFDAIDGRPLLVIPPEMSNNNIVQSAWTSTGDYYRIDWEDGHSSQYRRDWVERQLRQLPPTRTTTDGTNDTMMDTTSTMTTPSHLVLGDDERSPWSNWTETHVRQNVALPFRQVLHDERTQEEALRFTYKYGILLVTETPTQDHGAGVAALASALSGGSIKTVHNSIVSNYRAHRPVLTLPHGTDGPLRTLYGTVWSTTSTNQSAGASVADSAYGQGSLPLHTDLTYHRDPPGLQIFTMVTPASMGGQSLFADGLFAAETLRTEHPDAFQLLSTLPRRYRSIDPATGWHLEATGAIVQTNQCGQVVTVRHNDLDRLPDIAVTDAEAVHVSGAHAAWNAILARDETRLVLSLQSGDTVVLANQVCYEKKKQSLSDHTSANPNNLLEVFSLSPFLSQQQLTRENRFSCPQRCLHGRYSFSSAAKVHRSVMGCYVGQDELNSRLRMLGCYVID